MFHLLVCSDGEYKKGEYIVEENKSGDLFFILTEGTCNVYQKDEKKKSVLINQMVGANGDHFGEKALRNQSSKRTASVQVVSNVAKCLVIKKADVDRLIGDIQDVYPDRPVEQSVRSVNLQNEIKLEDLKVIQTLGEGGFGKVALVKYLKGTQEYGQVQD